MPRKRTVQEAIDFEPPHNGTRTSRTAAISMRNHTTYIRERIYEYIASRHRIGATADEIQSHLEIDGSTVRPRLVEMRKLGQVRDSGETRKTRSGRSAVIWVTA